VLAEIAEIADGRLHDDANRHTTSRLTDLPGDGGHAAASAGAGCFRTGIKPGLPHGCLHLPAAGLIMVGAANPADPIAPALAEINRLARTTLLDVLLLSVQSPQELHPVRVDVMLRGVEAFRCLQNLLLWQMRGYRTALIPPTIRGSSVLLGQSGLILRAARPYRGAVKRIQGLAFASAGQRLTLGEVE
jgi:hypothetical protein